MSRRKCGGAVGSPEVTATWEAAIVHDWCFPANRSRLRPRGCHLNSYHGNVHWTCWIFPGGAVCVCVGGLEQQGILLKLQSNISLLSNQQKHSQLLSFFVLFFIIIVHHFTSSECFVAPRFSQPVKALLFNSTNTVYCHKDAETCCFLSFFMLSFLWRGWSAEREAEMCTDAADSWGENRKRNTTHNYSGCCLNKGKKTSLIYVYETHRRG